MGTIRINATGSFDPHRYAEFGAMNHGHAQAVADTIQWLSEVVLPEAIALDHKLQGEGAYPNKGFNKNG